jgi:hypothetical protein
MSARETSEPNQQPPEPRAAVGAAREAAGLTLAQVSEDQDQTPSRSAGVGRFRALPGRTYALGFRAPMPARSGWTRRNGRRDARRIFALGART